MAKKNKTKVTVPEVVTAFDSKPIAQGLTDQYNRATQFIKNSVREVLKFGAMLIDTEKAVFAEQGGKKHLGPHTESGYGLEAWLAENCPDINYKTAMRWKRIAENAIAGLGCDTENGVLLLTGNAESVSDKLPIGEMMDRVDDLYEAKSLRQLSQMCFDFAKDDRADDGKKKKLDFRMPTKEEAAADLWAGIKASLESPLATKAIANLKGEIAEILAATLRRVADKMDERVRDCK